MTTATLEPITQNWTTSATPPDNGLEVSAAIACELLARDEVTALDRPTVELLAAAAQELATIAGHEWCFGRDDSPAMLVRAIAKIAARAPLASGPHTARLVARLGGR